MLARAASHLGAALFYKIFYKFFCKNLLTFANSFAIITHVVRSKHPDDASCGGLAQLGERLHGMQEVTGSIPVFSTTNPPDRVSVRRVFFLFYPTDEKSICLITGSVEYLAALADALGVELGIQPALIPACSL